MATITPLDYHTSGLGDYQYLPLKEIVNSLLFQFSQDDHFLKNTRRSTILYYAKECIRDFNKQVFQDILAMEITVPENLVIPKPHDYVDWVRVSVMILDSATNTYRLKPLDINHDISTAQAYLQNNNYEILFSNDGKVLTGNVNNAYAVPYKKYAFDNSTMGGQAELDTSKLSKWGEFNTDKSNFLFSSDIYNKDIVVEYLSDGLSFDTYGEDAIRVHKNFSKVLKDGVYLACLEQKRNIPSNEKERARRRFRTSIHEAKLGDFDLLEISRAMNASSKQL